jgi:hypothetical protein
VKYYSAIIWHSAAYDNITKLWNHYAKWSKVDVDYMKMLLWWS